MVNYEMRYGMAEAARLLNIEKDLLKAWSYTFSEYLNSKAISSSGEPREFNTDDLRVLSYISLYWEENPDLEAIRCGLNAKDYYELPFDEFITSITPLFIAPPEDIHESWTRGVIYGGFSPFGDIYALADSYKRAADLLVDTALANEEAFDLICPIIYNYRHATELYLKGVINKQKITHDLLWLLTELKVLSKSKFNTTVPTWFENIIIVLNDFDPSGTSFRYGGNTQRDEVFIDLKHLQKLMGWLAESCQNIYRAGMSDD